MIILFTIPIVILLASCSQSYVKNIDSFITEFNNVSDIEIQKTDFSAKENKNGIYSFCVINENILLSIKSDSMSMNIKSVSVTSEKQNDSFKSISSSVISTVAGFDREKSDELINGIVKGKEKEYANEMHTLDLISILYTRTKVGNTLTVTYNEEVPTETTFVPETAKEYSVNS